MTFINQGLIGAKRATWRNANPRLLLQKIITDLPSESEETWRELFWEKVENDTDQIRAIVEYWLDNNIRSLVQSERPQPIQPKKDDVNIAKDKMQRRVNLEARLQVLELVMPNNKVLGDCTGAECKKFGGWFTKLADRVPRNKTVSSVLTEAQAYKLYKTGK